MIKYNSVLLTLAGVVLSACVTINIYFPAAAAEKVADKIIEEVWQVDDTDTSDQSSDSETNQDKSK